MGDRAVGQPEPGAAHRACAASRAARGRLYASPHPPPSAASAGAVVPPAACGVAAGRPCVLRACRALPGAGGMFALTWRRALQPGGPQPVAHPPSRLSSSRCAALLLFFLGRGSGGGWTRRAGEITEDSRHSRVRSGDRRLQSWYLTKGKCLPGDPEEWGQRGS